VVVSAGGQLARLLYVSPEVITAQLAYETPMGVQGVSVNNGNGPSAAVNATVVGAAPSIFFEPEGGAMAIHESDGTGVSAARPARSGEVILVYATGLGQTSPASASGAAGMRPIPAAATVTATLGGRSAEVVRAVSVPGYPGLFEVALRVPTGIAAGSSQLVVLSGQAASAARSLPVAP
jgi:uncharacterized protein (TIGR03437 family)